MPWPVHAAVGDFVVRPNRCTHSRGKKWTALGVTTGVLLGAVWFGCRPAVHPWFGRIYHAEMSESFSGNWQPVWEKGVTTLRTWLHLPKCPVLRYLQIGPAQLEWSLGGHIYFEAPGSAGTAQWEFALSSRKRLGEVSPRDLRCEFHRMNDPRGLNIFGSSYAGPTIRTAWEERAIRVPDGQVLFARLATNRSAVYVLQLGRSRYFTNHGGAHCGRLRAQYVRVENQWPQQDPAPTGSPAEALDSSAKTP
jgi:hypothetical protein